MDEENQKDKEEQRPSGPTAGLAQDMQGMELTRSSSGRYAPVASEKPAMAPMGLPEEWGGRPSGTTRRAIRMQEAWDEQRKLQMEEAKFARDMELGNREMDLRERNAYLQQQQEARLQAAEAKKQEIEYRTSEDASAAMNEIIGGFDPQGNPVAALDPDSPDYMQRRNDIIKRYPRALYDDAFKTALSSTDKSHFDMVNFKQQQQIQEESSGRVVERQIAAEERAAERQAGIREEERDAQEERGIVSQEREIDKQIRAQRQTLAGFQGQTLNKSLEKKAAEARNKLLDLRIEKAALRGLVFDSEEEANAANPPSGSTIYIDRKPFKVD